MKHTSKDFEAKMKKEENICRRLCHQDHNVIFGRCQAKSSKYYGNEESF